MSSFIDLFEAGFFRKAGQFAGGVRQGISNAASAVGNAVSGAYNDLKGGYSDATPAPPAAPPPAAPPAAPPPAAPPAAPSDAMRQYVQRTWGQKYDALKQQAAAIEAEVKKFVSLPPDQQSVVMGQSAATQGSDRWSKAIAADYAASGPPQPQQPINPASLGASNAASPVPPPAAPVQAPAAPPAVKTYNWTPEQIAASQATANMGNANPWAARSNNPVYTRTSTAPQQPAYQDPEKVIRDARVRKGFADIDAKYAKRAQDRAAKGGEYAKVAQELAGKTPAQRRDIYKKWDSEKKKKK